MAHGNGLVLRRRVEQSTVVDLRQWGLGLLEITTIEAARGECRQHYAGDRRIPIHRKELFEAIERSKSRPSQEATE